MQDSFMWCLNLLIVKDLLLFKVFIYCWNCTLTMYNKVKDSCLKFYYALSICTWNLIPYTSDFFFPLIIFFNGFCNQSLSKTRVHVHKTQKPGRNGNLEKLWNTIFLLLTDNLSVLPIISFTAVFWSWLICYGNYRHVHCNLKP